MICPSCGAENPDDSTYCSLCMTNFAEYRRKVAEAARREEQNAYSDTGEALDIDFSRPQTSSSTSLESALDKIPAGSENIEKNRRWSFESGPLKVIIACGIIILLAVTGLFVIIFTRTSGKTTFKAHGTSLQFDYPSLWRQQGTSSGDDSLQIFESSQEETQIHKIVELRGMDGKTTKQVLRVFVAQDVSQEYLNYLALSLLSSDTLTTSNIENNGNAQNSQLTLENLNLTNVQVNGDEGVSGSLEMGFLSNPTKNYFLSFDHAGKTYVFSMAGASNKNTDRIWNDIVDSIRFEE